MLATYILRMCKCYNLAPVVQTLGTAIHQAPVVQKLDSAIHQINRYPADKYLETNFVTHWIVIYPSDSDIYLLNNWGLEIRTAGFFGRPQ